MTIPNPLLLQNPIEKVDLIKQAHVEEAISKIIDENNADIERIVKSAINDAKTLSWQSFMLPLEKLEDRLGKAWSPVSHLNSVCNSDELRKAYDKGMEFLTCAG